METIEKLLKTIEDLRADGKIQGFNNYSVDKAAEQQDLELLTNIIDHLRTDFDRCPKCSKVYCTSDWMEEKCRACQIEEIKQAEEELDALEKERQAEEADKQRRMEAFLNLMQFILYSFLILVVPPWIISHIFHIELWSAFILVWLALIWYHEEYKKHKEDERKSIESVNFAIESLRKQVDKLQKEKKE